VKNLWPAFLILIQFGFAYPLEAQDRIFSISAKLIAIGFENVRVVQTGDDLSVCIEDNIYRWNVTGIRVALDSITKYANNNAKLSLHILQNDIPQIVVTVPVATWRSYTNGLSSDSEISTVLLVTYSTGNSWNTLKQALPANPSVNKIDLVMYPQFGMQNTLLSQIYEIQLNLAPAIEVSLWKGMLFTGQVIFPIVNQIGYEGDFVRPGFITLSQNFRLPHQWFGRTTIGNFNANRYGADFWFDHPLNNNRWNIGLSTGLTGSSHFYNGQWLTSEISNLTWFTKVRYFYPRFNLQFDLSYGRYLNKDFGFRADCTRHFGETTIGFYAMYTGGEPNGGFHFSVPLPPYKSNRKHTLRLVPPCYFDWEYNAGTEFYYGRYYETRPNENRSEHWNNPINIKSEILKLIEK
jgi:hypothetical protein